MRLATLAVLACGLAHATTSYSNLQGNGDRRSSLLSNSSTGLWNSDTTSPPHTVDGDTSSNGRFFFNNVSLTSSVWAKWDFMVPIICDEATFYQQSATAQGTWKWQGSNDNSTFTDIGTSFALGSATTQTITALSGNVTAYRWYRILGVSGSTNSSPWIYQFEFKVSDVSDQRTDLLTLPNTVKKVRVLIPNFGSSTGEAIADVISLKVDGVEQVTNGSVETNTTGWSTNADPVQRQAYSTISFTPPGACGNDYIANQVNDQRTELTYQLIDISALDLTKQIDMAAYTGGFSNTVGGAAVAMSFEDASGTPVTITGVILRPYLKAARGNVTAVILRGNTIAAQVLTKGSVIYQ